MAMKTANEDVYFRIKSAGALKAAGIRLGNKAMEEQGTQAYAEAFIENAILVHTDHLTPSAREALARLLFDAAPSTTTDADDDITTDAEETTAELEQLRAARTPSDLVPLSELPPETLYNPDEEFEEDEPED